MGFLQIIGWIASAFGVIGVVVGAAFGCFRLFGTRWLDLKFKERLEAFKHDQQIELEQFRLRINTLFDRTIKLHQREFDVLPETWGRLVEAFGHIQWIVGAFQQYPDLDKMGPLQLDEFIAKSQLAEWQKDELKGETKKTDYYVKAIGWHRIAEARTKLSDYRTYLLKNGIFLPADLKAHFKSLDDNLFQTLMHHELMTRHDTRAEMYEELVAFCKKGNELIATAEISVQERFWALNSPKV